jgi:hypothetical protein
MEGSLSKCEKSLLWAVRRTVRWYRPMRDPVLYFLSSTRGRVPEWSNGADCKSVCRRFESARGLFPRFFGFLLQGLRGRAGGWVTLKRSRKTFEVSLAYALAT